MDYGKVGREKLDNDIVIILNQAMEQWKTQLSAEELLEGQPQFPSRIKSFLDD